MTWEVENCPDCGGDAYATLESLQGAALLERDGDDDFVYEGYTEIYWDNQETIKNADGEDCLICQNGHEWHSKRID